jgi:hypothetical protein
MSRYVRNLSVVNVQDEIVANIDVAYGYDYAMGYFVQVIDVDADEVILDVDRFDGLRCAHMPTVLSPFGLEMPEAHRQAAMLDLPF